MIISSQNRNRVNYRRSFTGMFAGTIGAAILVSGVVMASVAKAESLAPETLECDVQFEVQNFLKDSYLLQPSKDLPASIPTAASGQRPFGSYRLDIDWKKRAAQVHSTLVAVGSGPSGPRTYEITSDPAADVIQLEAAASEPTKANTFPSRFFIRRNSGWFMRLEPLSSKPSTGFTEVGVCGRDQKF